MRICAISDMHGNLPKIPPCDLLLIGGDICPTYNHQLWFQELWLKTNFRAWRYEQPANHVIYVAGNHDFYLEKQVCNRVDQAMLSNPTYLKYLQDESVTCEGLKIWGSPWQRPFFDWAFNLPEEELAKKWELIPEGTDIVLLHGPPYGYGDYVPRTYTDNGDEIPGGEHVGSLSLLKRIAKIKPRAVIYGHVHCGRGRWKLDTTELINATLVNEKYQMVHEPYVLELC